MSIFTAGTPSCDELLEVVQDASRCARLAGHPTQQRADRDARDPVVPTYPETIRSCRHVILEEDCATATPYATSTP